MPVRASAKYISNRCLPDKAIDLIDEAGAYLEVHPVEYRQRSYVTKAIIQQFLPRFARLMQLPSRMRTTMLWQRSSSV